MGSIPGQVDDFLKNFLLLNSPKLDDNYEKNSFEKLF